eukprot:6229460-Alexandrium_andersonii.AAC.1
MPSALQVAVPAPAVDAAGPAQPPVADASAGRLVSTDAVPPPPPPFSQTAPPPPPPVDEYPGPAGDGVLAAGHSVTATG